MYSTVYSRNPADTARKPFICKVLTTKRVSMAALIINKDYFYYYNTYSNVVNVLTR